MGDTWEVENVWVENHFALEDVYQVDLGVTPKSGVPIKIDCRFAEADLKIATGLVEPHVTAGFSGGRKVVAPGVAHHETIRTFHSARFMEHPLVRECNLDGAPLHEEQLEIVRRLGDVCALNRVIDDKRNLVFCSFGEIIESHLAAVDFAVTGITRIHDLTTAIADSIAQHGDADVAVIPEGPYVAPKSAAPVQSTAAE